MFWDVNVGMIGGPSTSPERVQPPKKPTQFLGSGGLEGPKKAPWDVWG